MMANQNNAEYIAFEDSEFSVGSHLFLLSDVFQHSKGLVATVHSTVNEYLATERALNRNKDSIPRYMRMYIFFKA